MVPNHLNGLPWTFDSTTMSSHVCLEPQHRADNTLRARSTKYGLPCSAHCRADHEYEPDCGNIEGGARPPKLVASLAPDRAMSAASVGTAGQSATQAKSSPPALRLDTLATT